MRMRGFPKRRDSPNKVHLSSLSLKFLQTKCSVSMRYDASPTMKLSMRISSARVRCVLRMLSRSFRSHILCGAPCTFAIMASVGVGPFTSHERGRP